MKKVVFIFALLCIVTVAIGNGQSDGYHKAATEQRDAIVTAQSADYL